MVENDKIFINNKEYTLGKCIGGGLEGKVFELKENPKCVVKIIDEKRLSKEDVNYIFHHLKYLKELQDIKKELKKIMTLPIELLDNGLGYVMYRTMSKSKDSEGAIINYVSLKELLNKPNDLTFDQWYKEKYSLKKRLLIIIQIFEQLRFLHLEGLVFTDLSPNNIMINPEKNGVVFIDVDNTRRINDRFFGVLGTPGYIAPELYLKNKEDLYNKGIEQKNVANCGIVTDESDVFSAAIIAFELLTLHHPFIGDVIDDGTPEEEERAKKIETDYIFKKETKNISTRDLVGKFNDFTTKKVRDLFYRTFVEGKNNAHLRPTDIEFAEAFSEALDILVSCDECGYSKIYDFSTKNYCVNCDSEMQMKLFLTIYEEFVDCNILDEVNQIGNNEKYVVNKVDELPNIKKIPLSKIAIEPGEKNSKYLYLRHVERSFERSKVYAKITLNMAGKKIAINKQKGIFENAYIESKIKKTQKLIGDGQDFSWENHIIVFDEIKNKDGFKRIIGEFANE